MIVRAVEHIKRMRGGSSPHLVRATDDGYYVVKAQNNAQHKRILANELICSMLLRHLGLPVAEWAIVDIPQALTSSARVMTIQTQDGEQPFEPGLCFGSKYPGNPARVAVFDYVPLSLLRLMANLRAFAGMAAFDKWVSNADGRQAIFLRDKAKKWVDEVDGRPVEAISSRKLVYVAVMVDHGFAFDAHNWAFHDSPMRGIYPRREVYGGITNSEAFEPWLGRIENLRAGVFDDIQRTLPPEWYDHDWQALENLFESLLDRRRVVRQLLWEAKQAERDPFPHWTQTAASTRA